MKKPRDEKAHFFTHDYRLSQQRFFVQADAPFLLSFFTVSIFSAKHGQITGLKHLTVERIDYSLS